MTSTDARLLGHIDPRDSALTDRALDHVNAGTTDLAPSVLSVPLWYYRDPAIFQQEQTLLKITPLALIASAQVSRANDFVVRQVMDVSILVTRGHDGVVRAFLNYCRHRGAQPAHGCGNARRFACPYHAWTYDNLGNLVGMPGAAGFEEVDRTTTGLVELPCEERHGLVWVVLTSGAPLDLDAHLGPLGPELATWNLNGYEHLTTRQFESRVNWKAGLEAFAESYHFPYVHANSIIGQNTLPDIAVHEALGHHHRICFPFPWIVDLDQSADPDQSGASRDPIDNVAIIYWIYPNLVLAFSVVGVELIDILPLESPSNCTVRHGWMAKYPATSEDDREGYQQLYDQVHAAVRDEDFAMLPQCGAGIRNGQHENMLIGRNEIGVQHLIRTFFSVLGLKFEGSKGG